MVQTFYRANNIVEIKNQFHERFAGGNEPDKKTIRRIVNKFENRGSVLNQNAGRSSRRKTRTSENIELVRQSLGENPRLSARRNSLDIPASIFNEITRLDLNGIPTDYRGVTGIEGR